MESRLIPLNALLATLTGVGGWPSPLAEQGLSFAWLEVPVKTSLSLVTVDTVGLDEVDGVGLIAEAKGGASLSAPQAKKYAAMTLSEFRRVVSFRADPKTGRLEPLYVCLAAHEQSIRDGLLNAEVDVSLLTYDRDANRVRLEPRPGSRLTRFDVEVPSGLPPRLVPLDGESPDAVYEEMLLAQIVAAVSRDEKTVPVSALLERMPYVANLSTKAKNEVVRRATAVLTVAAKRFPGDFEVRPAAGNVHGAGGTVIIHRSPTESDPRGETQGWQRLKRRAEGVPKRRTRPVDPNQGTLDELARQTDMGDT